MKYILLITIFSLSICNLINAQIEDQSNSNLDTDSTFLTSQYYHLKNEVFSRLNSSKFKFDIVLPFWLYYSAAKNTHIDTIGLKWILDRHGIDSTAQAFYCKKRGKYTGAAIALIPKIIRTNKSYSGKPHFNELKLIFYGCEYKIIGNGGVVEYPDGTVIPKPPIEQYFCYEYVISIPLEEDDKEDIIIQKQEVSEENHLLHRVFISKYFNKSLLIND